MSPILLFAIMVVTFVVHLSLSISANAMQNFFIVAAIVSVIYWLITRFPLINRE
jgi:hypothetical protein